jgi:multiple sugar transport system ATP-binding protein
MSFLSLEQLRKTYPDGTAAVKGIDLTIGEGEFIVLLGPSGCGKTTTLRMIAGLEIPTDGTIILARADVTKLRPSQRDVGFVFQFYALYRHLSVRDNIAFPLVCVGTATSEINQRVNSVAERLGLTRMLNAYPRQLSGGDQQRVSLGRAMVRRPRVWLMDEPLGTLDADQRLAMRDFIREQQLEAGVTTVYVTHDQEEAMSLADRIVVMRDGEILQVGTPDEVYERPADLFVANFVGSPGMNFIQGVRKIGIRCEHVRICEQGEIEGTVEVDEYLGSHRLLYVQTGVGRIVVREAVTARRGAGERVRLRLDPGFVNEFDGAGKRICLSPSPSGRGLG